MRAAITLLSFVSVASVASAAKYALQESFVGPSFLKGFDFQDFADPTHGRVKYVNQATALKKNLTFTTPHHFIMRADYTTNLTATGPGRESIRISSKKAYGNGVIILNLRHMPVGCGTWPAFWTNANEYAWPKGGEIDILEGVNDQGPNASVLHTYSNCTMASTTMKQTGNAAETSNCLSAVGNGAGCIVRSANATSYGPALNAVGGGWYAVERSASHINVWFWARNDSSVPSDVRNAGAKNVTLDTSKWGLPYANFVSNSCDLANSFKPQNIIFNLSLCGDWAGDPNAYPSTCPQTCKSHVESNPAAFSDAFWDIAALNIFKAAPTHKRVDLHEYRSSHLHRRSGLRPLAN